MSAPTVQLTVPIAEAGKAVAFIYNSMVPVPATITAVHNDGTVDLVAQVPTIETVVDHAAFQRGEKFILKDRPFERVYPTDPRAIVTRRAVLLNEPMVSNEGQVMQTVTDQWVISGVSRLPRFHDIATSLIGRWFDPSEWHYSIYCWIGPDKMRDGTEIPAKEQFYPKEGLYETYAKTFKRFFRERFENPKKWDRVDIRPVSVAELQSSSGT